MAKRKPDLSEFTPQRSEVRMIEDDRPRRTKQNAGKEPVLKQKAFRLPAEQVQRLAMLKAQTGRSEQELVAEALEMLLRQHGA